MELYAVYIPMDRRHALVSGDALPDRVHGSALFADISGFTPLTEKLSRELGPQRGAEELTRYLNLVYDTLIDTLHNYQGSVIGFSGDAITCWFNQDTGFRATACALAMQKAMQQFSALTTASGNVVSLAMKAAVASGPARRFLVGDPEIQVIDVLAGKIMDNLAAAEHHAQKGDVVLDESTVRSLDKWLNIQAWCEAHDSGRRAAVISGLNREIPASPWPPFNFDLLNIEQVRPWLTQPVYARLHSGQGEFLAELRPTVTLFLRFSGIDYDQDEAAGEKLDRYIHQMQRILSRYEATIVQLTIGDKGSYLCAAFGAPVAHEDDPDRAADAALELRNLAPQMQFIRGVEIGISKGHTRTGAYGGSTHRTYGLQGDDVNLSARLMQAAAPGQILLSKALREDISSRFILEELDEIRVKGKADPIQIFSLLGRTESRQVRLQELPYTLPMVGRQAELGMIESSLEQALRGGGQIVGITAEAGMGKSRLLAEAIKLPAARSMDRYAGECQSYGTNTSYLVWHSIWKHFFGLDTGQPLTDQLTTLEARLEQIIPGLSKRMPLLGAALNLPIPENDLTISLDAKLRKTSLEGLLLDCVRKHAGEKPLLFVLEDCHWIDPLSNELLEAIGRASAHLPITILLAYRPPTAMPGEATEPGLTISQFDHSVTVNLSSFSPSEAEQLIRYKLDQFFGSQMEPPRALIDLITARAEGNPFYIEELMNYLQDRGVDPHDRQALGQLELPSSLQSLILSRIDRLAENQKVTLKVASVIGRLFKAAMLWGLYAQRWEWEQVKKDLEALSQAEMVVVDLPEPENVYLFKNVVTQEVAYESLPFATRAKLHGQIGQYIERTESEHLEQAVYLLAFHYEHSQNEAKKREYLLKAGEAAQASYANAAAINYYQRALPLLDDTEKPDVMRKLAQVFEILGRWTEARELLNQALNLAEKLGDRSVHAWCQIAIGELLRKQGQYADASFWLERAWADFDQLGEQAGLAQALHYAGNVASQQGDYAEARVLYQQSLDKRRELGDKPLIASLLNNLGIVARLEGDYDQARSLHQEALTIRREVGDRRAIAVSLNNLGIVALDQGNFDEARSRLEEAVTLQREIGDKYYIATFLNSLANVARDQGDYPPARRLYEESLTLSRELGDGWQLAYVLEDMGSLAAAQGQAERALRLVGAASQLRDKVGAPRSPSEEEKLQLILHPIRQALDDKRQKAAWDEGCSLTLEQVLDYAMTDMWFVKRPIEE